MTSTFSPIFIVGMPRSGTKLVRDILNNHSLVHIPDNETHFIPTLLKESGNASWGVLLRKIKDSQFGKTSKNKGKLPPSINELKALVSEHSSTASFIEAILKYYGRPNDSEWDTHWIWGDKTPLYIRSMPLLKIAYPNAKFIHILRDPRDRAMSMKKTWGNSMYRACETWREGVEMAREFEKMYPKDFYELTYEGLLSNPLNTVQALCNYLNIEFDEGLINLKKPSEKHGKASSATTVISKNSKKFMELDKAKIRRMEEIAGEIMNSTNYETMYASRAKPLFFHEKIVLKISDFISFKINKIIKGY